MAEVVTGVVATMLLAVIVDGLILGLGRLLTPWRRNRKMSGAGSEER
jgi:osmoprotectant transport system permease protein